MVIEEIAGGDAFVSREANKERVIKRTNADTTFNYFFIHKQDVALKSSICSFLVSKMFEF